MTATSLPTSQNLPEMPARMTVGPGTTISRQKHNDLVEYLKSKLEFGNYIRGSLTERFANLDREIAGYIRQKPEQKQHKLQQESDGIPRPTDTKLHMTAAQIDEAVTIALGMLAPEQQIYKAMAPKEKMPIAQAFSTLMNEHATDFGHYKSLAKAIRDMYTYNLGGVWIDWRQQQGPMFDTTQAGPENAITYGVVNQGNVLEPIDPYNTIWDVSVPPFEVAKKGEFAADVKTATRFNVKRMGQNSPPQLFNYDWWIDFSAPLITAVQGNFADGNTNWYRPRPVIRDQPNVNSTDWINVFSAGSISNPDASAVELVHLKIWIRPKDFGLSQATDLQTWHIVLANNRYIVWAQHLDYVHGELPIALGMPWYDGFETDSISIAEQLIDLQTYQSFEMNVRQKSATRSLFGLLFVDKNAVGEIRPQDMQNGVIPINSTFLRDKSIRDVALPVSHNPIDDTWQNIDAADSVAQKIFPTAQAQQVADLERATQYQAAATVQGINRRGLKSALIVNDMFMTPLRNQQMWNIFAKQPAVEVVLPSGEVQPINPSTFRDSKLRFDVSTGLKGIDRLQVTLAWQLVVQTLLQNPESAAQIDVVELINYYTSLIGDDFNLNQFKVESPMDKLPPEVRDQAFALWQQAQAQLEGVSQDSPPARGVTGEEIVSTFGAPGGANGGVI